jgi:shikimate kinase
VARRRWDDCWPTGSAGPSWTRTCSSKPGFRDRETAILAELASLDRHIVATGGGVVLRPANRLLLHTPGAFVAWLTADAETLWQRISGDPATTERRPALYGGGPEEVARVLAEREGLYREVADVVVDVAALSPEDAVGRILSAWTTS